MLLAKNHSWLQSVSSCLVVVLHGFSEVEVLLEKEVFVVLLVRHRQVLRCLRHKRALAQRHLEALHVHDRHRVELLCLRLHCRRERVVLGVPRSLDSVDGVAGGVLESPDRRVE